MKFVSTSGSSDSFELAILGYGNTTEHWRDRNRLLCRFSTFWNQQADVQSAPLHTWEVKKMLSSLRSLWEKATNYVSVSFADSGLSLEAKALADGRYRLQIQFDRLLTPAWHNYPDFPLEMNLLLNRSQLQEAIRELSGEVSSYPER